MLDAESLTKEIAAALQAVKNKPDPTDDEIEALVIAVTKPLVGAIVMNVNTQERIAIALERLADHHTPKTAEEEA